MTYSGLFPRHAPIFVLGAARSGTSIVGTAIRDAAGLPGHHESFLFSTGYLLMTALDRYWREIGPPLERLAQDGRGDPDTERSLAAFALDGLLRDVLRHFHALATAHGEERWVDKTPDVYMVHATPILAQAYPRARFVFCRRSGVDVIDSRRRTHPEMTFAENCADWARILSDWQLARQHVEGRFVEVDQHDVAAHPEATAESLAAVLDFDARTAERIAEVFRTRRVSWTGRRAPEVRLALAETDWSAAERATFERVCGPMMRSYGYWRDGGASS